MDNLDKFELGIISSLIDADCNYITLIIAIYLYLVINVNCL